MKAAQDDVIDKGKHLWEEGDLWKMFREEKPKMMQAYF
jgi:hypothetical protein